MDTRAFEAAPGPGTITVTADGNSWVFTSADAPVSIGRDPDADVVLDGDLISRQHVQLHTDGEGWVVTDVGSRNGVVVDGIAVDECAVDVEVSAWLGGVDGTEVRFRAGAPGADRAEQTKSAIATATLGLLGRPQPIERHTTSGTPIVTIGRDSDNDIVIDDLMVSRRHAQVRTSSDGERIIVDLGSHNGTYLNGARVDEGVIDVHDLISIGNRLFRVTDGGLDEYLDGGAVMFHASDVVVERGGTTIVDGASIKLEQRSLMAIVGPSGAGKSTLATALVGLRRPSSGRVLYGGRDLFKQFGALRRRVGFVPQDDILHPELSVSRALLFAARLRFPSDVSRTERRARVDEVLEQLGLTHRRHERISNLSGGQRKRVSVALELLTKPSLLVLDEPTSGLDPGTERAVMQLLRELADGGHTVIVVTHHVDSLALCDRVLYLAPGGRQAYFGPPQLALAYFECADQQEIFQRLGAERVDWPRRYAGHPDSARFLGDAPDIDAMASLDRPRWRRQRRFRQFITLTSRTTRVLFADWRTAIVLLVQGPVLGLLFWTAFDERSLDTSRVLKLSTAMVTLLLLVVGASWIGLSNAIREIVKERALYRREAAVGLSPTAYLASKVFVLWLITAGQVAAMMAIALIDQGGPADAQILDDGRIELALVAIAAGLAAAALGLMVSALVRTSDQAIMLLPVLLVPLLVLAIPDVNDAPGLQQIRVAAPSQWAFQSAAVTADLNRLQVVNSVARDLDDPELTDIALAIVSDVSPGSAAVVEDFVETKGERRFRRSDRNWSEGMVGIAVIAGAALFVARLALRTRLRRR